MSDASFPLVMIDVQTARLPFVSGQFATIDRCPGFSTCLAVGLSAVMNITK
jgi:hypothetical protein